MIDWFGPLPFSTKKAIFNPHVVCTSKWQCINQTPTPTQRFAIRKDICECFSLIFDDVFDLMMNTVI